MNKQCILNVLALIFSFSALTAKPNVQRTAVQGIKAQHKNAKSARISTHVHTAKTTANSISDTIPSNAHEEHLTIGESWSKFLRLKWMSLSRHDAWNIGTSIVMCGALVYLSLDALIDPDAGNNEDRTCNICLDTKKGYEFCTLSCCGHNTACVECLQEMMDASLQEKKTTEIKCPNQNCARAINNRNVRKIVKNRPDMYKAYNDVTKEEQIAKHGIHCPTPDCTYALMNKNGRKSFNCPQCKKTYCIQCARQHPATISCKQAKLTDEKQANDDWIQNHSKKCPQCKKDIEKNDGCNHMTCKCRHEFCWECLGSWNPKRCNCPIFPANQNNNEINNGQHNQIINDFDAFLRQFAVNNMQQNNQRNNNQPQNINNNRNNANNANRNRR